MFCAENVVYRNLLEFRFILHIFKFIIITTTTISTTTTTTISTSVGRTVQVHFAFEGFVSLKHRVETCYCVTRHCRIAEFTFISLEYVL